MVQKKILQGRVTEYRNSLPAVKSASRDAVDLVTWQHEFQNRQYSLDERRTRLYATCSLSPGDSGGLLWCR